MLVVVFNPVVPSPSATSGLRAGLETLTEATSGRTLPKYRRVHAEEMSLPRADVISQSCCEQGCKVGEKIQRNESMLLEATT